MIDPIGSSHHLPPSHTETSEANVPHLAKKMQDQVQQLADNLQKILDDPSLTQQSEFLKKMSEEIAQLQQTVGQAMKLR